MPEAPPNFNDFSPLEEHYVRGTGQVASVHAEPVPQPVECAAHDELGLGVASTDARHQSAALGVDGVERGNHATQYCPSGRRLPHNVEPHSKKRPSRWATGDPWDRSGHDAISVLGQLGSTIGQPAYRFRSPLGAARCGSVRPDTGRN